MEIDIILKALIVALAVHDLLSIAVRFTKTPKDDDINNRFGKFLNVIFSATNTYLSATELQEKVKGASAIGALESIRKKYSAPHQRRDIDKIIHDSSEITASRLNNGLDLIPNNPMTVPGKIANVVSSNIKSKKMKTKLGKNIQTLFRRID